MKRLSLAGVAADQAVSVRVGPYVPLTVDLSSESSGRVLYWMVDPNEGTHAEIGVHSGSGQWESFEIRIYSSPMERLAIFKQNVTDGSTEFEFIIPESY